MFTTNIDGILYPIINVLVLLFSSMGPTPVAGFPGGTTAAFLNAPSHGIAAHASSARLK